MKHKGAVIFSVILIQACSMPFEEPIHTRLNVPFASNQKNQYLDSDNGPKLQVLPPLSDVNLSQFYVLPPKPDKPQVVTAPPIMLKT